MGETETMQNSVRQRERKGFLYVFNFYSTLTDPTYLTIPKVQNQFSMCKTVTMKK